MSNFYDKFKFPALFSVRNRWEKSAGDFNLSQKLLTRQLSLFWFPSSICCKNLQSIQCNAHKKISLSLILINAMNTEVENYFHTLKSLTNLLTWFLEHKGKKKLSFLNFFFCWNEGLKDRKVECQILQQEKSAGQTKSEWVLPIFLTTFGHFSAIKVESGEFESTAIPHMDYKSSVFNSRQKMALWFWYV